MKLKDILLKLHGPQPWFVGYFGSIPVYSPPNDVHWKAPAKYWRWARSRSQVKKYHFEGFKILLDGY